MEFQDKVLKGIDCGADFVFTAGEQLFFHDKQFKNQPKRCKPCKTKTGILAGVHFRGRLLQSRDPHQLFGMRQRNYRPVQTHTR